MDRGGSETAAPTAIGSGSIQKTMDSGFKDETYRSAVLHSIPSSEHSGRLARVVRCGDRLFAVGAYREPRA